MSERRVFDALQLGLPADWTVLHSRKIVIPAERGRRPVEGESDFLVIDPRRGFAVLEVKGGQSVGCDRNGWFSVDSGGRQNPIKDPGAQVQQIMHTTMRYLQGQRGYPFGQQERRFSWGVILPDFDVKGSLGPALPKAMVIDRADLGEARKSVARIFDGHAVDTSEMQPGAARFVIDALGPCFRLVRSLATRIEDQEADLIHLTEEQARVLEAYDENPRVGVRGVAGSGKTLIAMEKARRLAADGKRVIFLCYNQPLARHLERRAKGFRVSTFHSWCINMAKAAGLGGRLPNPMDDVFFGEGAPQLLLDSLARLPDERWDAILVDEGQDFLESWWIPIEEALKDAKNGILYVFWDPDQDLYGGGPTKSLGLVAAKLDYNCRNTRKIAEYAASHVGAVPKFRPGTPDGDDVLHIDVVDHADMKEQLRKLLHRFVREEGISTDRIAVLGSAFSRTKTVGPFTLVDVEVESPGPWEIRFSTVPRFKGLEADVVVLCEPDAAAASGRSAVHHVGSSRAKHFLAILQLRG